GVSIAAAMFTSWMMIGSFHRLFMLHPWSRPITFVVVGAVLWALSGIVARRIAWPLAGLARAASEFGAGKLDTRARVPHHSAAEIRALAQAWNDMAERIETHVKNQT